MATAKYTIDEGSTTNFATNTITEDAVTKHIPRATLAKSDGTELATSSAPLEVNLRSSTVGVATSANQSTANTSLASIDGKIPASPATAGNQTTANTSLSNIDTSTAASKTDLDTIAGAVSSSKMAVKTADGDQVTLGAKADAKSTATDTTAISVMSVLKQISASVQAPPSQAVTNAGTFAVQIAANSSVNIAQIGGNNSASAGVNGTIAAGGPTASGSAVAANPLTMGGRAATASPTAVADGQVVNAMFDKAGKQVQLPYAFPENFVQGVGTATGTSGTSVISAQGANIKIYITAISVANTGAAGSLITIQQDPAGTPTTLWYLINPSGGGDNITFPNPIVVAANKAVGFTAGTASTTQYVSISGYIGA